MIGSGLTKYRDVGILILRIGIGAAFVAHGLGGLLAGPAQWSAIGSAMGNYGIHLWPEAWGLIAKLVESVCGALVVLGLLFRPACLLLVFDMLTALLFHLSLRQGFNLYSHALEAGVVFLSLLLIGPGKYSVDRS